MNTRAALLLMALSIALVGGAHAQSDDPDPQEAVKPAAPKPLVDQLNHHHGNGGDDPTGQSSLRRDPADVPTVRGTRPDVTGLAQAHAPLPGEMGEAPEVRRPLFAAPPSDLAIRSDPWALPDK